MAGTEVWRILNCLSAFTHYTWCSDYTVRNCELEYRFYSVVGVRCNNFSHFINSIRKFIDNCFWIAWPEAKHWTVISDYILSFVACITECCIINFCYFVFWWCRNKFSKVCIISWKRYITKWFLSNIYCLNGNQSTWKFICSADSLFTYWNFWNFSICNSDFIVCNSKIVTWIITICNIAIFVNFKCYVWCWIITCRGWNFSKCISACRKFFNNKILVVCYPFNNYFTIISIAFIGNLIDDVFALCRWRIFFTTWFGL